MPLILISYTWYNNYFELCELIEKTRLILHKDVCLVCDGNEIWSNFRLDWVLNLSKNDQN